VVGATVHVTWVSLGSSNTYRRCYRRSTDGGQIWEPKILLFEGESIDTQGYGGGKYLAVDGDSVHVANVAGSSNGKLMYRRSIDHGASFEDARQLAGLASDIRPTRIAASDGGGTIALTHNAKNDFYRPYVATLNSADGGASFTHPLAFMPWGGGGCAPRRSASWPPWV
jgi:hypothetical protein